MALPFSMADRIPRAAPTDPLPRRGLAEGRIELLFQAAAEATQEAVLDALAAAAPVPVSTAITPCRREFLT